MKFEDAVEIILRFEGGYSLDVRDPGGETNFGISKRSYPHVNIKILSRETAIALYKKDYWDKLNLESLPSKIRLIVFDAAVNQGPTAAVKFLQGVARTDQDGVLGRITMSEINKMDPVEIVRLYAEQRARRYISNPNFAAFGSGWLRRLLNIVIDSLV